MVATLERKIDDETSFRLKNEEELRNFFENRFSGLADKVKSEEKL